MSQVSLLDTLSHPLFFETFERFPVEEGDLLEPVSKLLTGEWLIVRRSVWFNCSPPARRARDLPTQGWKIHVSSTVQDATDVLAAVVPILDRRDVAFKFALDRRVLGMMNGKSWDRQGAGKFITIYPVDRAEFVDLLEELHRATGNFVGIYILSDRRYRDSKVLFYRYGGIRPLQETDETGRDVHMLVSPTGELVPDERRPVFQVPPWETDPFGQEAVEPAKHQDSEGRIALKNGRYLAKHVFGFTNAGGIYIADDMETGDEVVIKEARPFVTFGSDATALLEKEFRILSLLAESGSSFAPKPIDLFVDWEHTFLVQELIQGLQLRAFTASHNVTLLTDPGIEDTTRYVEEFREVFRQLAEILATLHEHGIVYGDLSPSNVLIQLDPLRVRLIDFEAAYVKGIDTPSQLFTLGFAHGDQMYGQEVTFESDYFALGALMHYAITPVNQIFGISPKARYSFIRSVIEDIGFPEEIHQLIVDLIGNDTARRPAPTEVVQVLARAHPLREPSASTDDESAHPRYAEMIDRICEFCLEQADYERKDRLFPAYGAIFNTNPLSLAYGACGVAHALQAMECEVPTEVVDWILQPTSDRESYPPGLYQGLSGIAWTVFDLGRQATAERIMALAHAHPLRGKTLDLFHGLAGMGLTNLYFFLRTQNELYLDEAIEAGVQLVRAQEISEGEALWGTRDGTGLGLGHGGSGIAVFLLYLWLVSGREEFLSTGKSALEFDLSRGVESRDGGLSWTRRADGRRIVYPYFRYGSAGVGTALVRYYAVLGESHYYDALDRIFLDLNRKYAVFPGFFVGLAGVGEALLDFHGFTSEDRFLRAAYRIASGLSLFGIKREDGLAFPGDGLTKICCDLATGSAGIGRFFHRLASRTPAPFFLDELLGQPTVTVAAESRQASAFGSRR